MDKYQLWGLVHDEGFLTMEISQGMYGLPLAGKLANDLLKKRLATHGYYECEHTPGYFKHILKDIQGPLIVDDFGVQYTTEQDVHDLIKILSKWYKYTVDWEGKIFVGISLK
ncbi:hypothetical protein ACHAWF_000585 [Thalassiosira exigua]